MILGCTMTVGEQAMNVGRNAALAAGFPDTVPGTTVDRQCGSAQQAVHFAAQAVMSGAMDVVIGGGVEAMSRVPIGSTTEHGSGRAPTARRCASGSTSSTRGSRAEEIARRWGIDREEMDRFAAAVPRAGGPGHRRGPVRRARSCPLATRRARVVDKVAVAGSDEGDPAGEGPLASDEGVRAGLDLRDPGRAAPVPSSRTGWSPLRTSSQISDGAAAVLIMSEERAGQLGLRPRARFHTFAVAANDPVIMLTAPIPATTLVLEKAKLSLDDIDLIEINEAFASVVLAWEKEHHPDMDRVNVNGGAIAIGHPTGASGARLLATLLNEMERTGARYGLQTMCEGGGQANATIIERLG